MPKPTRANGHVAFSGEPPGAVMSSHRRIPLANIARGRRPAIRADGIVRRPTWIARDPAFISNPADIRPDVAEDHRLGLQTANQIPGSRPIIVGVFVDSALLACPTVITVAPVGAVMPN